MRRWTWVAALLVGLLASPLLVGASQATASTSEAAASTAVGPIPRLSEFRVKTYRSGYQELRISFEGKLPYCDDMYERPAKIKLIFKGSGVSWRASNTWCRDLCDCALGMGTWGGSTLLFENFNDAITAKKLVLVPTESFGNLLSIHKTFYIGYWVIIEGRLARKGRLALRVDKGYRTIWDDEDDFINVCINDLKKLYSSGGRLYCLSLQFDYRMRLLRPGQR